MSVALYAVMTLYVSYLLYIMAIYKSTNIEVSAVPLALTDGKAPLEIKEGELMFAIGLGGELGDDDD